MMAILVPIKDLFDPVYGVNLELVNLEICKKGDSDSIRYISRKESNNGVAAYVKRIEGVQPNPAHTISVAVSGSVLSAFYQNEEYYSGRDIYILNPLNKMSVEEMLFYSFCLRANKYKYNYGRGANRTLKDILVPDSIPSELKKIKIDNVNAPNSVKIIQKDLDLSGISWSKFTLGHLFKVTKGRRLTKEDMEEGETPFIAAIDSNNGWRQFISQSPIHSGNTITVNYNGSVAEAFYQPMPFWASDDVNVLYPKFKMNIYTALFISTVIEKEKYRFNFGRKWHKERMEKSQISLPQKNGNPDFQFMENFIKSLPYSSVLKNEANSVNLKGLSKNHFPIKGLSDEALIEKYEVGKVDIDKLTKKMIKQSPTAVKSDKQKSKIK